MFDAPPTDQFDWPWAYMNVLATFAPNERQRSPAESEGDDGRGLHDLWMRCSRPLEAVIGAHACGSK